MLSNRFLPHAVNIQRYKFWGIGINFAKYSSNENKTNSLFTPFQSVNWKMIICVNINLLNPNIKTKLF